MEVYGAHDFSAWDVPHCESTKYPAKIPCSSRVECQHICEKFLFMMTLLLFQEIAIIQESLAY